MIRYIVHCDKSEMVDSQVFPLNATTMFDYATFLQRSGKFSAIQSFMEAVTFCQHVVGVDMIGNVTTPWMRGITRDARMHRAAKKQSRLLTVSEIRALEKYVINGKGHPYDVHAAGCFVCLLYGRARVSDIRNVDACIVDTPDESDERHGYVEFSTFDYKKARVSKFTGTPFIVLVPVYGLEDASWGIHFIKNARQIGLDFEKRLSWCCSAEASREWTSQWKNCDVNRSYRLVEQILGKTFGRRPLWADITWLEGHTAVVVCSGGNE